ncbi:MAG: hypothetical protein Kow0069_12140 [Promethearchaeota archaeon]
MRYDVVVVGAGTTGATAAQLCAREFSVAVLEAAPREFSRISSGVFPNHNFVNFPPIPREVFERDHLRMKQVGFWRSAVVSGQEFGLTLGKTVRWRRLKDHLVSAAEERGARFFFSAKVQRVEVRADEVRAIVHAGGCGGDGGVPEVVRGDVVLLATGVANCSLPSSLGFSTPPVVRGIQREFQAEDSVVDELGAEYCFHLDPRISRVGPCWVTAFSGGGNVGYIDQVVDPAKLERVLEKYAPLEPLRMGGVHLGPPNVRPIASSPLRRFSTDRVLLLGECAGLVNPFYYEGVWEGRVSARLACQTLLELRNRGLEPTREGLRHFDEAVDQVLVKKFIKSGQGSAALFYHSSEAKLLFDHYLRLVEGQRDVREKIVEAYNVDAHQFNLGNDRSIGERIFANIPLVKKIKLLPAFLRAA